MGVGLLGIGTSGLLSAQRALDTIGQNISNAENPDYHRQTVEFKSRPAFAQGGAFLGTGVEAGPPRRQVDEFVANGIRVNTSSKNELEVLRTFANDLDNFVASQDIGLADGLNQFFVALQDVSQDPNSVPARQVLLSQTSVLMSRFGEVSAYIENQTDDINQQIGDIVNQINRYADTINSLNNDIRSITQGSEDSLPNTLLDLRDATLNDLAALININRNINADGTVDVSIASGQSLVTGATVTPINARAPITPGGTNNITYGINSIEQSISEQISGGKLGGLLRVKAELLDEVDHSVGRIALTLAQTMNEIHQQGIDFNGNAGGLLFTDPNESSLSLDRVVASTTNNGDAVLVADILPIRVDFDSDALIQTSATGLVAPGTNTSLTASDQLNLNGIAVRAITAGDDTLSSFEPTTSAIAIANAINANTNQHGVTAKAEAHTVNLGAITLGAIAAGEFQINGVDVTSAGTSETILLQDINALSPQTGVSAAIVNGQLALTAADGRNIHLASNTNTPAASFANFDISSNVALSEVARAGVTMTSARTHITVTGAAPSLVGLTTGTSPADNGQLTTSDYELIFDGSNYTLTRLSDSQVMGVNNTPNFTVDGFELRLETGSMAVGDSFLVRPTNGAAGHIALQIADPKQLALALPVAVSNAASNRGNAALSITGITNSTGQPVTSNGVLGNAFTENKQLSPPLKFVFLSDNQFQVYNIEHGEPGSPLGPVQTYEPSATGTELFPLAGVLNEGTTNNGASYEYDPGYRLNISGQPQTGDVFTIGYNHNPAGDNRNALKLVGLQTQRLIENGQSDFNAAYAQMVGTVGARTAQAGIQVQSLESAQNALYQQKAELSGVNLEEEAANLLRFEQAFQASAQLIVTARSLFDTVVTLFGGR